MIRSERAAYSEPSSIVRVFCRPEILKVECIQYSGGSGITGSGIVGIHCIMLICWKPIRWAGLTILLSLKGKVIKP